LGSPKDIPNALAPSEIAPCPRLIVPKHTLPNSPWRHVTEEGIDSIVHGSGSTHLRTAEHARDVIARIQTYDLDVAEVRRAGRYIDLEELRVQGERFPSAQTRGAMVILVMVTALLTVVPLAWSTGNGTVFQVKKSGVWFSAHPTGAKLIEWPLWHERQPLTPEACRGDLPAAAKTTQLPLQDVDVICKLINDPQAPEYVATSLAKQRIALALLAALLGSATCWLLLPVIRVDAAGALAKRLQSKQMQGELPL
jgi:Family of unknown function (DUF6216)